jgi:hypothetical protein
VAITESKFLIQSSPLDCLLYIIYTCTYTTMAPKKSIYRRDGAQHFQLVHRSQRDPLINDSEAGQQVLKPVGRPNDRKVGHG